MPTPMSQTRLPPSGTLLLPNGRLAHAGWSPQPTLECNLEAARFYPLRALQRFRIKRWDYYAIFTPRRFFSATIADLGYAGNLFVYTLEFATGELHEEGIVVPLARGISLPRSSTTGESRYLGQGLEIAFSCAAETRRLSIDWSAFDQGRGIRADLRLACPPEHESMNIVIPIGEKRFYYNRKINCMPTSGQIDYGAVTETLTPDTCLGSLDWGRGVWEYRSFWN